MKMISKVWLRLGSIPLLQNLSWMMVAEALSRLSRIVTLFVLAAYFANEDYGLAMLALLIHELFRVFTRLGTGAKIIQCDQAALITTLQNAATLQWFVALTIAALQIATASLISRFYEMPLLEDLLCIMALAHIFYPLVAIRIFEQHRISKLRYYGLASGVCISFENLLVAGMVLAGADVFAVATAKVSAAICWVLLFWRLPTQLKKYQFEWRAQKALIGFSCATLLSELSRMLRFQCDSLIAARLLPPDVFGTYSFAKSAGLGIAQSFSQAYMSALYPYLCNSFRDSKNNPGAIRSSWRFTAAITFLFLTLSFASCWFIECFFGARWGDASLIASILCLVAIPTLVIDHQSLIYRAKNMPLRETIITSICAASLCIALLIRQPDSVLHTSTTVLGVSFLWCLLLINRSGLSYKPLSLYFRKQPS